MMPVRAARRGRDGRERGAAPVDGCADRDQRGDADAG